MTNETEISFYDLGLSKPILSALNDLGYKKPSPIQQECIPYLLDGHDVLGTAQTGSGKTAAFSLPLLHNIDITLKAPQILVLAPTRELAIQVAEAMREFSKHMYSISVVALYGGQRYDLQLRALRKCPQIVVGTPGRLLDHLKRRTLNLSHLHSLILDEADEMLRMGFIEDVTNIMNQIPNDHQTGLFSATIPEEIRRISSRFMKSPKEISTQFNITMRPDITQSYWSVHGMRKNEALVRFLEMEDFDAAIIFVRTKNATLEVAETLERSGYNSSALNGDMNQTLREQTLDRLKDGRLDILIATDVAARGLDLERITLVINYDIPMDVESYVHRIGRTGRAGRSGRAILFVNNREHRLLRNIERTIKQQISEIKLPSSVLLSERRQSKFAENIQKQLKDGNLEKYRALLSKLVSFDKLDMETLASVLLKISQGNKPLILPPDPIRNSRREFNSRYERRRNNYNSEYISRREHRNVSDVELYRIEIGSNDGIEIRHVVGAIANEADISSRHIGNIKLFATYSTIELPKGMTNELLSNLRRTRILNKPMQIKLLSKVQEFNTHRNGLRNSGKLHEQINRLHKEHRRNNEQSTGRNERDSNIKLHYRNNNFL
ncbi:MAG: DEAD/DEAH family ATP-dependent RNA helicase [Arsenophonus sp.]